MVTLGTADREKSGHLDARDHQGIKAKMAQLKAILPAALVVARSVTSRCS